MQLHSIYQELEFSGRQKWVESDTFCDAIV